jgi:signal transduction histidine kinase
MSSSPNYSAQIRAERLISAGRLVLAACALTAVAATPAEAIHPTWRIAYALLGSYAAYALVVAVAVWRAPRPLKRTRLVTHLIDLLVFAIMYVFEQHVASGFFVFFVFSLLSATLRWQWRGTLFTAVTAFGVALVSALYQASSADQFESNRVLIRGLYLSVVAVLLGYLGVYEVRLRREISRLATWSSALPDDAEGMIREVLTRIADVLSAPRVLLMWEEREEPWLNVALWTGRDLHWTREAPDALTPATAEHLASVDFFCSDAEAATPTVVYAVDDEFRRWRGAPLNPTLRGQFNIRRVLAVRFESSTLTGRIFWLDKPRLSTDQLAFGKLIAREVANRIDHFHLLADRWRAAAEAERVRLARDLHDGLQQSLTAMALKLEEVRSLVDDEPVVAQKRLLAIQRLIVAEQRYLRFFIRNLKPFASPEPDASLDARLELLGQRVELEWGVVVDLRTTHVGGPLSASLSDELYYLVSEAIVNAARHAKASTARVELDVREPQIEIVIADNGHGFPFRGRYDHVALKAGRLAPVTLGERVEALQGTLMIDSSEQGARIEIVIPRRSSESRVS